VHLLVSEQYMDFIKHGATIKLIKLHIFYCFRRHKITIKVLLCNTQHFIVDSDM